MQASAGSVREDLPSGKNSKHVSHSDRFLKSRWSGLNSELCSYLVLAGLVQDVQGLHRDGLVAVVELRDQQLDAPVAEEFHVSTEEYP